MTDRGAWIDRRLQPHMCRMYHMSHICLGYRMPPPPPPPDNWSHLCGQARYRATSRCRAIPGSVQPREGWYSSIARGASAAKTANTTPTNSSTFPQQLLVHIRLGRPLLPDTPYHTRTVLLASRNAITAATRHPHPHISRSPPQPPPPAPEDHWCMRCAQSRWQRRRRRRRRQV
jgi:hypothetical protein